MTDADALHRYLEASALSFADRNAYVGDPAFVDVPVSDLLSDTFAKERACEIDPDHALNNADHPEVAPGDVTSYDGVCDDARRHAPNEKPDTENVSTTNLTASDKWGNVAEYTLTIEQTGGSGIVVPGRGFLLNNELTDFTAVFDPADPNRIEGGKRPRSSISPTIVLDEGKPFLALGSPGGSTIITTVLQILFNRIDRGMTLPEAVAAPRASQRNTPDVTAEQAFIDAYGAQLTPLGHSFVPCPVRPAAAPRRSAPRPGSSSATGARWSRSPSRYDGAAGPRSWYGRGGRGAARSTRMAPERRGQLRRGTSLVRGAGAAPSFAAVKTRGRSPDTPYAKSTNLVGYAAAMDPATTLAPREPEAAVSGADPQAAAAAALRRPRHQRRDALGRPARPR